MGAKLLYGLILLMMGTNGALYLSWYLSPPNPDRIGFWFVIYFLVFPVLAVLGLAALLFKSAFNIPIWIGVLLLLYVGSLTLLTNSHQLGFAWVLNAFPPGGFELLHVLWFGFTLAGLLVLMLRR